MTYQVMYNPTIGNSLVGVATHFDIVPEGFMVETIDEDLPDLTKCIWSEGSLRFVQNSTSRNMTPTEFMRRFTLAERLTIRGMERDGDLVIIDAMALMNGTKEGVDLNDPDVMLTLGYLVSKGVITPERMTEILS